MKARRIFPSKLVVSCAAVCGLGGATPASARSIIGVLCWRTDGRSSRRAKCSSELYRPWDPRVNASKPETMLSWVERAQFGASLASSPPPFAPSWQPRRGLSWSSVRLPAPSYLPTRRESSCLCSFAVGSRRRLDQSLERRHHGRWGARQAARGAKHEEVLPQHLNGVRSGSIADVRSGCPLWVQSGRCRSVSQILRAITGFSTERRTFRHEAGTQDPYRSISRRVRSSDGASCTLICPRAVPLSAASRQSLSTCLIRSPLQ
jgi:hypothetical protein